MLAPSTQPQFSFAPLLALPVLLPLVLLQGTLFAYMPIGGVVVQMAVVVVLAVALWRDSAESIIWAFIAGILIDLNSIGPLGGTTLALIAAVLVIAPFRSNLNYNRVILPIMLAAGGMFVFQLASLLLFRFAGITATGDYNAQLPARVIVHTLLAVPIYWLLRATNIFSRRPSQINL